MNSIKRSYKQNVLDDKELFLSPQIYSKLLQHGDQIEFDQEKEDVYNLGMFILSLD